MPTRSSARTQGRRSNRIAAAESDSPDVPLVSEEGEESEGDLGALKPDVISGVAVTATDWTTETIIGQMEKGNLNLDPDFQRRDAWTQQRKSAFIESLLLGLPVPQLVLAENKQRRNSYIVIDGKQRLLTLSQFAIPQRDPKLTLVLDGLKTFANLNGKTYQDLISSPAYADEVRAFENQPIRTVVMRNWVDDRILYLMFLRLNTGSLKLSPQELRRALHPGRFVDYALERSAQSRPLQVVMKLNGPDFRMRDVEVFIRYFGFARFLSLYSGNIKQFLDLTCEKLNQSWSTEERSIKEDAESLDLSLDCALEIFGKGAFRKWNGARFERPFNRAVFDVMTYYFRVGDSVRSAAVREKVAVEKAFKELCTRDVRFRQSIETTTKSLEATASRLSIWGGQLRQIIGVDLPIPRLDKSRLTVLS